MFRADEDDDDCWCDECMPEATMTTDPMHPEQAREREATAWDAGHRDGCDDHVCVEMGHLHRNPFRDAEGGDR